MKEKKLTTYDVLHVGDSFYYVCNEFNLLIKFTGKGEHKIIGVIPEESLDAKALISQMMLINERIILIPLNAKNIWIYQINNQKWHCIRIENESCEYKFMKAIQEANKLYFFPSRYKKMIVLDVLTDEVRYIEIADKSQGICNSTFFRSDIVVKDKMVYAAYCGGDYIFEFNLLDETYEWKKVGTDVQGYCGIAWDSEKFWLLSKMNEKKVFTWDGKASVGTVEIATSDRGRNRGITVISGEIIVLRDNESITMNLNANKDSCDRAPAYFFCKKNANTTSFLRYNSEYTWIQNDAEHRINLTLSDKMINNYFSGKMDIKESYFFSHNEVVTENELFRISDFVKVLSSQ
ncbi:MAG: hypothetical protein E7306_07015 [Butyrivibrio sp.]|nr:hypothetical protein [Butyrivibrio sp.]